MAHPTLMVALALAAGVLSQSAARHMRVPGIVLLLAVGIGLGPDAAQRAAASAVGSVTGPTPTSLSQPTRVGLRRGSGSQSTVLLSLKACLKVGVASVHEHRLLGDRAVRPALRDEH